MSDSSIIETAAGLALLRRSNRRTLEISVMPNGSLVLVAPIDSKENEIMLKVAKRLRWISRQRTVFADMYRNRAPLRYESGATHRYLGRQYRLKVEEGMPKNVKLIGGYFRIRVLSKDPKSVENALEGWMRTKAREQFSIRLTKWEPWCLARGLPRPQLRLLKMPKRWGSAHTNGLIFLNPDLVKAPSICIDYVITHEICHLKHPNHGPEFYKLLEQLCSDWKRIKARLETDWSN